MVAMQSQAAPIHSWEFPQLRQPSETAGGYPPEGEDEFE
jgi:hypothetical protein